MRVEKTLLGNICTYIKEVYSPRGCYLELELDSVAIEKLQLEITPESVCESILMKKGLKVKREHIHLYS